MTMYNFRVWGNGHSNERVIIPETVDELKRWELYMPKRYADGFWKRDYSPPGTAPSTPPVRRKGDILWAIAYGHAEGGDNAPFVITEEMEFSEPEAEDLLLKDARLKAKWVDANIEVPLTTYMYGCLVSLTYQFGQGRLNKAQDGTLTERPGEKYPFVELFNKGQYVKALTVIRDLNFTTLGKVHDGLTLRRCSEIGFAMRKKEK